MTCPTTKIDSNITGLSYAEESCYGVLPDAVADSGAEDDGVWYPLDPNGYQDFGAEVQMVERAPINASRQRRKGEVTDVDASGGYSQDLTQTTLTRLMQGFFFADAHERVSNAPINDAAADTIAVVDIEATGSIINVDTGDGAEFAVGMILKLSGFVNSANNQTVTITSITTDELTTDGTSMVDETWSAGNGILEVVGFEYPASDVGIVLSSNTLTLTSSAGFGDMDYQVGEWIFIGGDDATEKFTLGGSGENAPGYARIEAVTSTVLTLKEPTFTALTDVGSLKTIRIYAGKFLRNESTTSLIKTRSYQLERTLGSDDNGVQSEVLVGSIANEFTLNVPSSDKVTCDFSFVAKDNQFRTGTDGVKPGDRTNTLPLEDGYNTSSEVYQQRLFIHGNEPTPSSLFAYVSEASLSINNNAVGNKAIATLGNFSVTVGDFVVTGNLDCYFTTVEAVNAVRNNSDVGYNLVMAKGNAGLVYDIPLLSLSGGRISVEKDAPVKVPLGKQAAECDKGYTLSATYFNYLPDAAM